MIKRILPALLILGLFSFFFSAKSYAASAVLSLSPAGGSYKVNDTFDVSVLLNSGGGLVGGVDVYMTFNKNVLNLVDITNGAIFNQYLGKSIDNTNGTAAISGITSSKANAFSSSDTFVTLNFKAVGAGTSEVKFNFTPGNTRDSNVVDFDSGDILASVVNGTYTVTGVGGTGSTGTTTVSGPTATKTIPVTANGMPTLFVLLFGIILISLGVIIKKFSILNG